MIRTNELMLGDIVGYIASWHEDESGELVKGWEHPIPIKVSFITPDMVQYENEDGCHECADYELHPIPLTPEILEKNGFSQDPLNGHIFIFQEKSGEVIYYEYGSKYGLTIDNQLATIQDLKIKYVHQLQNALRLAGIERDITV